jgi:WD40 repeat protein
MVHVWDTSDWSLASTLEFEGAPGLAQAGRKGITVQVDEFRFSPDEKYLAIIRNSPGVSQLWRLEDGELLLEFKPAPSGLATMAEGRTHRSSQISAEFSADSWYFACVCGFPYAPEPDTEFETQGVKIVDLRTGEIAASLPGLLTSVKTSHRYATCACKTLAFDSASKQLAIGCERELEIYDLQAGKTTHVLPAALVEAVCFLPGDRSLAVVGHDSIS